MQVLHIVHCISVARVTIIYIAIYCGHHPDITFVNMTPNQLLLLVNWLEPACI